MPEAAPASLLELASDLELVEARIEERVQFDGGWKSHLAMRKVEEAIHLLNCEAGEKAAGSCPPPPGALLLFLGFVLVGTCLAIWWNARI